jgi:hypothetical protein
MMRSICMEREISEPVRGRKRSSGCVRLAHRSERLDERTPRSRGYRCAQTNRKLHKGRRRIGERGAKTASQQRFAVDGGQRAHAQAA